MKDEYIAVCNMSHCYKNSRAISARTCHHPAKTMFPPLLQPIKAGTRFSNPGGMQGWVYSNQSGQLFNSSDIQKSWTNCWRYDPSLFYFCVITTSRFHLVNWRII